MNKQLLEDCAVIGTVIIGIVGFVTTIVNTVRINNTSDEIKRTSELIDNLKSEIKTN